MDEAGSPKDMLRGQGNSLLQLYLAAGSGLDGGFLTKSTPLSMLPLRPLIAASMSFFS